MEVILHKQSFALAVRGVVVRPCTTTSCAGLPQTLAFFTDSVYEICDNFVDYNLDDGSGKKLALGDTPLPIFGTLSDPEFMVYEPTTDSIYYTEQRTTIMRLDASNRITMVTGFLRGRPTGDEPALFQCISALSSDGKGNIFVSDAGFGIFRLDLDSQTVVRLSSIDYTVTALTYDAATDVLVGATPGTIFHLAVYGGHPRGGGAAVAARDLAGSNPNIGRRADGGTRFRSISAMLAAEGGGLLIFDDQALRLLDTASGQVTTLKESGRRRGVGRGWLAILPTGQVVFGAEGLTDIGILSVAPSVRPACEVLAGWTRPLLPAGLRGPAPLPASALQAPDAEDGGDGGESPIVKVRMAGGKAYLAHRAVLAGRSEYFRQRLATGGGFSDSGAQEVNLTEADPEAFGCLLAYMYGSELRIPSELLRPAAELAGMLLLMSDEYLALRLQQQVLESVTPRTVVSELVWAERHSLRQLVPQLKAYLVKHRKQVAAGGPRVRDELMGLMALNPELAAEIMLGLAAV